LLSIACGTIIVSNLRIMFRWSRLLILAALSSRILSAQYCPPSDGKSIDAPQPSVLHGTIKLHPGTRPWLGLVLAKPACGASEIELAFSDGVSHARQMDHCSVTVKGVISESPTIYYSADLNIFNPVITPDPGCKLFPPDPDYSKVTIPSSIKSYEVTVFRDIRGNKPVRGEVVSSSGRRLEPWQPYVQLSMNGEEDLTLNCPDGFELTSFKAKGHGVLIDATAWLYAEKGAPASLTIVCRRDK
jgi:hypothetical protein